MTDLERVIKIIDCLIFEKKIKSRRELAEKMGYTESSMSQILNGKVPLSKRFLNKLSLVYDSINLDTLITSDGEKFNAIEHEKNALVPTNSHQADTPEVPVSYDGTVKFLEKIIGLLEQQLKMKDDQIERMEKQLCDMVDIIKKLSEK